MLEVTVLTDNLIMIWIKLCHFYLCYTTEQKYQSMVFNFNLKTIGLWEREKNLDFILACKKRIRNQVEFLLFPNPGVSDAAPEKLNVQIKPVRRFKNVFSKFLKPIFQSYSVSHAKDPICDVVKTWLRGKKTKKKKKTGWSHFLAPGASDIKWGFFKSRRGRMRLFLLKNTT